MNTLKKCLTITLLLLLAITGAVRLVQAEEKVVITMTGSTVGKEGDLIRKGADLYMQAHPNVDIRIMEVPDSTTARLMLYLKKMTAQRMTAAPTKILLYRAVLAALSACLSACLASCMPAHANCTDSTDAVWPSNVFKHVKSRADQTLTVLSPLAEARHWSTGENSTAHTPRL